MVLAYFQCCGAQRHGSAYKGKTQRQNTREGAWRGKREFQDMLKRVLRQDFSAGTEGFCDALPALCSTEFGSDDCAVELDGDALETLVAAGSDSCRERPSYGSGEARIE